MMEKRLKEINDAIDRGFREQLEVAVAGKFGIEIETTYNIMALRLVTRRVDGNDFSEEEHAYIRAFEAGYMAAWSVLDNLLKQGGEE